MNDDSELYNKLDEVLTLLNDNSTNKSYLSYPLDADINELSNLSNVQNYNQNEKCKVSFSPDNQMHQYNPLTPIDANMQIPSNENAYIPEQNESFFSKNSKFLIFGGGAILLAALVAGFFWYKKNKDKKEREKIETPVNVNFETGSKPSSSNISQSPREHIRTPQRNFQEEENVRIPRRREMRDNTIETDFDIDRDNNNNIRPINTARIIDNLPDNKNQLNMNSINNQRNNNMNYPFAMPPYMNWNYQPNPYIQGNNMNTPFDLNNMPFNNQMHNNYWNMMNNNQYPYHNMLNMNDINNSSNMGSVYSKNVDNISKKSSKKKQKKKQKKKTKTKSKNKLSNTPTLSKKHAEIIKSTLKNSINLINTIEQNKKNSSS